MRRWLALVAVVVLASPLFAAAPTPAAGARNPFFAEWTRPFGVPPFGEIKEEHYLPAIREGIERQRREVAAVAGSRRAPTFANTIEALDASGELLAKVNAVLNNMVSAETNDRLQAIAKEVEANAFEKQALARIGMMPEIVVRYRSPYFNHIFGPGLGYSAGYYSYVWSEVLDADAFQAFREHGLFDQATAKSFRTNILERGGSEEPAVLYRRFRGAEPAVEPLLVRRGLK